MVLVQSYGIPIGSRNVEAAKQFIDFSLSPDIQANWMRAYKAIPVNKKAYGATAPELIDPNTKQPWTAQGYYRNIEWWAENRTKVNASGPSGSSADDPRPDAGRWRQPGRLRAEAWAR